MVKKFSRNQKFKEEFKEFHKYNEEWSERLNFDGIGDDSLILRKQRKK